MLVKHSMVVDVLTRGNSSTVALRIELTWSHVHQKAEELRTTCICGKPKPVKPNVMGLSLPRSDDDVVKQTMLRIEQGSLVPEHSMSASSCHPLRVIKQLRNLFHDPNRVSTSSTDGCRNVIHTDRNGFVLRLI